MSAFPTTRPFQRPKVRRATTETGPNAAEGRTDSTRKVNENDSRDGDFGQRLLRSLLLSVHWISFYRYTFAQETHTFYGNSLKTLLYFVSDRLRWVGIKSNTIFGCICPINVIYCTVHSWLPYSLSGRRRRRFIIAKNGNNGYIAAAAATMETWQTLLKGARHTDWAQQYNALLSVTRLLKWGKNSLLQPVQWSRIFCPFSTGKQRILPYLFLPLSVGATSYMLGP